MSANPLRLSTSPADRIRGRDVGVMFVLCGAIFLEGVDVAMLNIALPSIRAELNVPTTTLSAVVSAYMLGYAGFLLLGGRAADLFGRRRMFLGSLAAFVLFSGLGGLATDAWMLLASRFATGVASAFMTPAGLSLITTNFPEGPQRNKAVLIYAATASAGFSLGLVAGGLLSAINWRWVFFAPVILAGSILIAAPRLISDSNDRASGQKFDIAGAVTLTGAMLLAAYGVTRLEHPSVGLDMTLASFGASAALFALFAAIQRGARAPLVRFGILGVGSLARANLAALLLAGSFFGFQFLVSLYLQELRGWTPLQTSLSMIVMTIDAVLAATLTPKLVARYGNLSVIFVGLVLAAIAYALFLRVTMDWTYAAMFPTMLLIGLAFAFAYGPLTILATDGVAGEEQGLASGMFNTAFQFGAALGLSAVSAICAYVVGDDATPAAKLEALRISLILPVATAVLAALIAATGLRKRPA